MKTDLDLFYHAFVIKGLKLYGVYTDSKGEPETELMGKEDLETLLRKINQLQPLLGDMLNVYITKKANKKSYYAGTYTHR